MRCARWLIAALCLMMVAAAASAQVAPPAEGALRVAQFNAALTRPGAGVLLSDIREGDAQVAAVAEIIRVVRPDILLLNELDRDAGGRALDAFASLLARPGAQGREGIAYPHRFQGPANTGVPSGLDLDGDGRAWGPGDAWGWGDFPGQYAMAVLSRYPLVTREIRSWQHFPWSAMPGALRPMLPDGEPFHSDETWAALRLSSKSHWAVPVETPGGTLTLLAAHPTPPVFDGPEDRNGRRNHDEIRLLHAIAQGEEWLVDDDGRPGGLMAGIPFVIAGDLNADPADGAARREALLALLADPSVQDPRPTSTGAVAAAKAQGAGNARQAGRPAFDTADWRDSPGPGNLRVDYVLPSAGLRILGSGVFWPAPGEAGFELVGDGKPISSDHRLVWVDVALPLSARIE
ncbi:MAG: endonuclease/exonuclease/phosphatase family protein [Pseudomonadota bacterium]